MQTVCSYTMLAGWRPYTTVRVRLRGRSSMPSWPALMEREEEGGVSDTLTEGSAHKLHASSGSAAVVARGAAAVATPERGSGRSAPSSAMSAPDPDPDATPDATPDLDSPPSPTLIHDSKFAPQSICTSSCLSFDSRAWAGGAGEGVWGGGGAGKA